MQPRTDRRTPATGEPPDKTRLVYQVCRRKRREAELQNARAQWWLRPQRHLQLQVCDNGRVAQAARSWRCRRAEAPAPPRAPCAVGRVVRAGRKEKPRRDGLFRFLSFLQRVAAREPLLSSVRLFVGAVGKVMALMIPWKR